MKVLQVIDSLQIGGAEKIVIQISNLLNRSGITVELVVVYSDGILRESLDTNIPVHFLFRKSRIDFVAAKKLAVLAREFDLIHVHMRHNYRYVALIKKLFPFKSKLILHDHFGSIEIDKSVPKGLKTLMKPTFYIGVSKALTNWAKKDLNLSPEKVFLLENTIHFVAAKKEYPLGNLVLVSNIKPIKNQLFALELLAQTNKKLTIFGAVQDRSYWNQVKASVEEKKLENRVNIIHDCTEVQPLLPSFQLGINTSVSESGPLVLLEFLAHGLPFLAYKTGAISRKLNTEFPEYFVDHFDVSIWQAKIMDLLTKKPDQEKMHAVFKKYFSEDQYLKRCLKIYKQVKSY